MTLSRAADCIPVDHVSRLYQSSIPGRHSRLSLFIEPISSEKMADARGRYIVYDQHAVKCWMMRHQGSALRAWQDVEALLEGLTSSNPAVCLEAADALASMPMRDGAALSAVLPAVLEQTVRCCISGSSEVWSLDPRQLFFGC